ncbi:MAG: class I SAM-dependent methyltransferase [Bacillota bacterium]
MLSPRLKAVADLVQPAECIADIGTDHALLPVYLVEHGVVSRVIAVEKAAGPTAAARRAVAAAGLEDRIEVRVGVGLSPLAKGEAEAIVIAGMGGETIADILAAGAAVAQAARLVVAQPMNRVAFLRRWLTENGWRITAEVLVPEGRRLYQAVAAAPGASRKLNWMEEELGPYLLASGHPLLKELAARTLRYYEEKLAGLSRASRRVQPAAGDFAELARRCEQLRAYLERDE